MLVLGIVRKKLGDLLMFFLSASGNMIGLQEIRPPPRFVAFRFKSFIFLVLQFGKGLHNFPPKAVLEPRQRQWLCPNTTGVVVFVSLKNGLLLHKRPNFSTKKLLPRSVTPELQSRISCLHTSHPGRSHRTPSTTAARRTSSTPPDSGSPTPIRPPPILPQPRPTTDDSTSTRTLPFAHRSTERTHVSAATILRHPSVCSGPAAGRAIDFARVQVCLDAVVHRRATHLKDDHPHVEDFVGRSKGS